MADKQDRWLDRETAERLLRGESAGDAVGPEAGEQAERLARTLAALSALGAEPLRADEELPGESAALKAFSEARAERERSQSPAAFSGAAAHPADAGLVRIGGRNRGNFGGRNRGNLGGRTREKEYGRRSRPVRFGLAAALAVGIVGGVVAGTGLLPRPFDGAEPEPGASVSIAASPDRPLVSPSPDASGGGTEAATPDGGSDVPGGVATGGGKAADGSSAAPGAAGAWPKGVTASCREVRAGRTLDTERRTTLEGLAGGSSRVSEYCADVLEGDPGRATGTGDRDEDDDRTGGGTVGGDKSGGRSGGSLGMGQDEGQDDKPGTGVDTSTGTGTGTGSHAGRSGGGGHGNGGGYGGHGDH